MPMVRSIATSTRRQDGQSGLALSISMLIASRNATSPAVCSLAPAGAWSSAGVGGIGAPFLLEGVGGLVELGSKEAGELERLVVEDHDLHPAKLDPCPVSPVALVDSSYDLRDLAAMGVHLEFGMGRHVGVGWQVDAGTAHHSHLPGLATSSAAVTAEPVLRPAANTNSASSVSRAAM